ncbi:glycoside hydrolase family 28 protein [Flavisolibacter ginsenosidimutans]|uniref:Glycoside hydrolase family 28 protein n=1 Tax=Flavisolibacter ginsenosidimutans TaxID=661481 RepID=A0A5B8UK00_9BACT|nr:glycoside hydrolase family 28 protein [Flavisolibacter ginsenosidimutans]QEC56370.1 glycoside hydrolase family 28 protein [Flavisolibacter ginsenosidimutans]
MKKFAVLFFLSILCTAVVLASPPNKFNLFVAPGTLSENTVTLLWDKQSEKSNTVYEVSLNGKAVAFTSKTNYTLAQLQPNTTYTVGVRVKQSGSSNEKENVTLRFKTAAKGKVYNILDYGAKADSAFKNTKAIQAAIDACTDGGTVYIPKGSFVSGALFLKSNMTLYIEKDAVLKGSTDVQDYLPMILNRFEGWELKTYASLLNAGTLNRAGTYNVKNLRITGGGTISGGGKRLGDAMIKASGIRSRGRLVCLMNCQNVCLSTLTVTEPPCWTVHYIYSNNVTCHDLNIVTNGIRNGDGIDPDSTTDSYIFNCTFDTGDDCIAIKSGKNPEGFFVAKPTKNVRITDCDFKRGHGISIGSEMSGGVSDVLVQNCKAGALLHGMQIKGTKDRGGYVKNVTVADCQLLQITVFSAVNYNNDGEPAPEVPTFENFVFKNIDLSGASLKEPVIDINGFKDPAHRLRNVSFTNILLPENAKVVINDAENVSFINVKTTSGAKPQYTATNSSGIVYEGGK